MPNSIPRAHALRLYVDVGAAYRLRWRTGTEAATSGTRGPAGIIMIIMSMSIRMTMKILAVAPGGARVRGPDDEEEDEEGPRGGGRGRRGLKDRLKDGSRTAPRRPADPFSHNGFLIEG